MPGRQIAAALCPAHNRKPAHAALVQPCALFAGRKADIGFGPFARPMVFLAVEPGRTHPVLQGQIVAVANAQAPLLG